MKKNRFAIICLCFCWLLCSYSQRAPAQTVEHVILVSIDGFRPEMYLDKSWPAPNLQQLMQKGTYAEYLNSVFPSYTYPSHTAMLTGALPARSGIYFNQPKNSKGQWNWFVDSVHVPTLWEKMKNQHMTTAAVEWPVSVHAPINWNIPEIWSEEFPDRITESRKYATPGLVEEIEARATGFLDSVNMSEQSFMMDANSARMAAYIFTTYRPNLLAIHFAEVDGMEHQYGREGDSVLLAVAAVDRCVGELLEAVRKSGMQESTTILIVGDHGFATISQVFRPNMLVSGLPARFIASGGSAFLYVRNKDSVDEIISIVTSRLHALPEDKQRLFRIIDRTELDKLGVDSSAVMALAARNGLVFSGAIVPGKIINQGPGTLTQQDPLVGLFIPTSGGHHGYLPSDPQMHTGFIAVGCGIMKGNHIKELSVADISPLIARLLRISFTVPDGKLIPGIIDAGTSVK